MAYVDLTQPFMNYVQYVFGNEIFAAMGFLFILTLVGIRYGFSLESFIIVFTPTLLILLNSVVPLGVAPLMLIGLGLLIGFGLLGVIRR